MERCTPVLEVGGPRCETAYGWAHKEVGLASDGRERVHMKGALVCLRAPAGGANYDFREV